jgi:hypothetical protein
MFAPVSAGTSGVVMIPFGSILLGSALMVSAAHPIQMPQLERNSQRVVDWFASASGLETFGCNDASFAYIDGFLSRQGETLNQSQQTSDRVVSLIGSFLGQCVVQVYGGRWVSSGTGLVVEVKTPRHVHTVQPFDKVAKRLRDGESESLVLYYRNLLPAVFGNQPESASAN